MKKYLITQKQLQEIRILIDHLYLSRSFNGKIRKFSVKKMLKNLEEIHSPQEIGEEFKNIHTNSHLIKLKEENKMEKEEDKKEEKEEDKEEEAPKDLG